MVLKGGRRQALLPPWKMDFTPATYTRLIKGPTGFRLFVSNHRGFLPAPDDKSILLRHDVDLLPQNALAMAKLEHGMGVVATYYFRAVPESWDEEVIREIASLGHEVGYHYENLSAVSRGKNFRKLKAPQYHPPDSRPINLPELRGRQSSKVDVFPEAFRDFKENLEKLRRLVPVSTVCMHGSPLSGIDNLDLLKKYDYKSLGLVAEPYLDLDFDQIFYLTDTGRRWDGWKVSVRDKMPQQEEWIRQGLVFHSTCDIIRAVERGKFPDKVMMTVHPQRWDDRPWPWAKELVFQNAKNVVKRLLLQKGTKGAKGMSG